MQSIFLVEDDDNIRELVSYALGSAGFELESFASANPFFERLTDKIPQLILLDIMLPEMDGISMLKQIRKTMRTRHVPVVMLTAKSAELDRVKGLDFGADDYISKPFSVLELIARVRAVLRRADKEEVYSVLVMDDITLDVERRTVVADQTEVKLTYREFELLRYLVQNKGLVLSRDKIMQHVWGIDASLESRTVDMHIKSLRQKLGHSGQAITTVWGVGYKMGK